MNPGNANNAIQVILQSEASAQNLVEASPLKISLSSPSFPAPQSPFASSPSDTSEETPPRIYQITAFPSKFQHRQSIIFNTFYGPFSPEYRSPIAADLTKSVPLPGVSDVHWGCWGGRRKCREVPDRIAKLWIKKGKDTRLRGQHEKEVGNDAGSDS